MSASLVTLLALVTTAQAATPVADAGSDTPVDLGDAVTLDGSGSSDADGDTLSYRWKLSSVPAGSALWSSDISDRDASVTDFTPDVVGSYEATLKVDDGSDLDRDTVTFVVTDPNNNAPVADASSSDADVYLGNLAGLDATASTDADGDTLSYRWKFISVPDGSSLWSSDINDRDADATTFTPDAVGDYTVNVKVSDGQATTSTSWTVSVTDASNNAPVADAGSDAASDLVAFTLDASGSSDADGDTLTYRWKLVTSASSSATDSNDIADRDAASTTFTPDVVGDYTFRIKVDDGQVEATDFVTVTVSEWGTYYADVDADGFGDASSSTTAESEPSGYVTDATDCDDGDDMTYPGAEEVCDGVQNDCDDGTWASDAGLANFVDDATSTWTDYASDLGAGTSASPTTVTLSDDGALYVCEGTWYATMSVSASVDVIGVDGKDKVIFSGGDSARLLSAGSSSGDVVLEDLTLTAGYSSSAGGAIYAVNGDSLTLTNVDVTNSEGTKGGGGHFYGLDTLTMTSVTFSGNTATNGYGGGANVWDVTDFTGSDVTLDANENTSSYGGGGLACYGSVTTDIDGLTLTDNIGAGYGGGWSIIGGTHVVDNLIATGNYADGAGGGVDSTGALTVNTGTFYDNEGNYGGAMRIKSNDFIGDTVEFDSNYGNNTGAAIHLASSANVDCTDCDFTDNSHANTGKAVINNSGDTIELTNADFSGNTDYDVKSGSNYTLGTGETLTCDSSGCV